MIPANMIPTDEEILCYLFGYLCELKEEDDSGNFNLSDNLYLLGAISTIIVGAAVVGKYAFGYFHGLRQENRVMDIWEKSPEKPTPKSEPVKKGKRGPKRQAKRN